MKLLLSQGKSFYFLAFYIFINLFFIVEEVITFKFNYKWIESIEGYLTVYEVIVALMSITGIYLLLKELKKNQEEIDSAKNAIENLKSKNRVLNDFNSNYWESVKAQFKLWSFTDTEIQIAVFILRGLSNQQIAAIRNKSLKTIENQTFAIFHKSGMTGKLEFIAYFISPLLPEEE